MGEKKELRESKEKITKNLEKALVHIKEAELECISIIFPSWQRKERLIIEVRGKLERALKFKEK